MPYSNQLRDPKEREKLKFSKLIQKEAQSKLMQDIGKRDASNEDIEEGADSDEDVQYMN